MASTQARADERSRSPHREPREQVAQLIDGRRIAAEVRAEVKVHVEALKAEHATTPKLGVILAGNDRASRTFVNNKARAATEAGIEMVNVDLPEEVTQAELLAEVQKLNDDTSVHAILVQLPLPKHIVEHEVLEAIQVEKDVDGLSMLNIGRLVTKGGRPPVCVPCTPAGVVELLQHSGVRVAGKSAVVIGRSNLVGVPLAAVLQSMEATVTVCHTGTTNLPEVLRGADIVVAACGSPQLVRGSWLKSGCVVIDVGINGVDDATRKAGYRLVGDVHTEEAMAVASQITPVPGGVGPMTIAMLLMNTVQLTRLRLGLPRLKLRRQ